MKYYTPKIEEFYLGFEYEVSFQSHAMSILDTQKNTMKVVSDYIKSWEETSVRYDEDFDSIYRDLGRIKSILKDGNIRVKYLDENDIIDLGFVQDEHAENFYIIEVREYFEYWVQLQQFEENRGWLLSIEGDDSEFSFQGWVKNKSELKQLLKKLDVL